MADTNEALMRLSERIGQVDAKANRANERVDEFKNLISEDMKEIKTDLKILMAAENKRTGWIAAMVFIGSLVSGIVTYLAKG